MGRYVEVPTSAIYELMADVERGVKSKGGSVERLLKGKEVVFDIHPPNKDTIVRLYTSAANGADVLRACDKDAVRVVVGVMHEGRFRPTHRSQKLLRTAPTNLSEEERVNAFVGRLREALRSAYLTALREGKKCPDCGTPMALRKGKNGEFLGCLAYPKCKTTMPLN